MMIAIQLLAEHRDQQERVAEEMIQLTRSLAEQSAAAGALVRQDTTRLEQSSQLADTNLERLGVESKRVGEFSARGNCRCWIWLMMVIVVLTFIGESTDPTDPCLAEVEADHVLSKVEDCFLSYDL